MKFRAIITVDYELNELTEGAVTPEDECEMDGNWIPYGLRDFEDWLKQDAVEYEIVSADVSQIEPS